MDEIEVVFDQSEEAVRVKAAVLVLASPVFDRMLSHKKMQESKSGRIELKGKDPEEFKTLLSFLMPGSSRLQKVTPENVDFLLTWSDEYCLDALKAECLELVKTQPPSVKGVHLAHTYGMVQPLAAWIDKLLENGVCDWDPCCNDMALMKIVLERSLLHGKKLQRERDRIGFGQKFKSECDSLRAQLWKPRGLS